MNWKTILLLSCFGIFMGIASLFGLTQGIELWLWLGFALGCSFWLAKKLPESQLSNGVLVGLFCGILNSAVQSMYFDLYLSNNPASHEEFAQIPGGLAPSIFVLLAGFPIGLVYGLVIGLLTLAVSKFIKPKSTQVNQR